MAAPILLYLLKANLALLLFAAAYFGLLRRLTFFTLNRAYLVFALLFAAVYPALPVPALLPAEVAQPVAFALGEATTGGAVAGPVAVAMNWPTLALALYAAGTTVLLARLLGQLLSLWRVRRQSWPAVVQGQTVRVLAGTVSPFSFGTSIYLNPDLHPAPELTAVLRHEQVHVRQWHTLDGLLAQLVLAAAWCNPAAWLLRRAMLDNLEYLADHAVLQAGLDRQAYQFSLLRLSHGAAGPSLVSHFSFPTLKNRVIMMNTPLSSTGQLARYFVAGPLVLAVALGLAAARAQGAGPTAPTLVTNQTMGTTVDPAIHPLPDGIKAYIAKTYPGSSIGGWFVSEKPSEKAPYVKYYASVTEPSGEKHKLYFNADAQPVLVIPRELKPTGHLTVLSRVYVDGQVYTGTMDDIGPKNIASINVYKGDEARRLFGAVADTGDGVVVVTTIANQNQPAVRAFNEKLGIAPAAPATPR